MRIDYSYRLKAISSRHRRRAVYYMAVCG